MLSLKTHAEIARELARRVRKRRLYRGWTQEELARRAGIKTPTYVHFERTGQIAVARLIRIFGVLDLLAEIENLVREDDLHGLTLDQVVRPERHRGRRRRP
jgi:transcriptional regulator with XRE-family HTH domain